MKIWQKIIIADNEELKIKEYKFLGVTLLHKEKNPIKKFWRFLGIKIAHRRIKKIIFPTDAVNVSYTRPVLPENPKKIAIFAAFSTNGKIADYVLYYLKELKKVCDEIIFIADCPIHRKEVDKIKNLVCYAKFERHEEYDFGSYKRGYEYALKCGLLDSVDEFILCNDSCFGPVFPLKEIFETMENKKCDFWGLSSNIDFRYHLQSFFLVFKKNIVKSNVLNDFLGKVEKQISQWSVVSRYETKLTQFLADKGFIGASYIPDEIEETEKLVKKTKAHDKTVLPLTMMKKYHFPLIKVKSFIHKSTNIEKTQDVLDFVKENNPILYDCIKNHLHIK